MTSDNKYDVVIIGGGTAGVSCAWNCGARGLKTLVVEKNSFLGGSITASLVIPAMKTSPNAINTNFYENFYKNLSGLNGAITYSDGNRGWFNPELTKIVLDKMMQDANVDVIFESSAEPCNVIDSKILSIHIDSINNDNPCNKEKLLSLPIKSKYYVDGTGFGNFCQKLNCEILKNNSEDFQPVSLRFIMSGIDVNKFSKWLTEFDKNRDVTTACTIGGNTYLSTAYTWDNASKWALGPLFKRAVAENVLTESDTNYFQIFSVAGTPDSIAFNAPRLLSGNKTNSELYIEGRAAILRLANFCKKYLTGFENAYISNISNSLGIRVSTRIRGKYLYTYNDLISGKRFDNPVLRSNYPVDIHSDKKDNSTLEKVMQDYELPLESLQVYGYDNLFVIGRCISADFKAQAALRIIPSCFSMGEGLAKFLSGKISSV